MEIHIVRTGESLADISRRYGINTQELACANGLQDLRQISPGLALLIPGEQKGFMRPLELCLCSDSPHISRSYCLDYGCTLSQSGLPIFSHEATDGRKKLLTVSNLNSRGSYSARLVHDLLCSEGGKNSFIDSIISGLKSGNYMGLHLNFNFLHPFHREAYSEFLGHCAQRLHVEGLYLTVSAAPKEAGEMHEAQDLAAMGKHADRVLFLSHDWGHVLSAPQAVSPLNRIVPALETALEHIPPEKLLLGFSDYACKRSLPWNYGDRAKLMSNPAAQNLAVSAGAEIRFDESAGASWFTYTDPMDVRQIVWFEDVRSFHARLRLLEKYSLAGIGLYAPEDISPALALLLENMFEIK